jgi:hypothetical protein
VPRLLRLEQGVCCHRGLSFGESHNTVVLEYWNTEYAVRDIGSSRGYNCTAGVCTAESPPVAATVLLGTDTLRTPVILADRQYVLMYNVLDYNNTVVDINIRGNCKITCFLATFEYSTIV